MGTTPSTYQYHPACIEHARTGTGYPCRSCWDQATTEAGTLHGPDITALIAAARKPVHRNDTYGEISDDEHQALRAKAHPCARCGMLADVDPELHRSRYGHAPRYTDETGTWQWRGLPAGWVTLRADLAGGAR